ncbi:MAG TPA: hypothetical protein VFH04_03530, partial [Nitrososphaeraceae archaeon]|nr:hypothetical protein [Nitrososphaeraceae archaeon]
MEESDRWLYPSDFFELTPGDRYQIKQYAQRLQELHTEYAPVEKVDSSNAYEQYRELNAWNRERHNELVVSLERPYEELIDRIVARAIDNQHQLEQACSNIPL